MSFGGVIKLTGEQEYKRALEGIRRELKEVGAQMKLTAEQYKSGSDAMGAMSTKAKLLEDTLKIQERKISALKDKQKELNDVFSKSARSHEELVRKYEVESKKLQEIEKTLGSTSKEYKNQKAVVEDLAVEVKKSTTEQDRNAKAMSTMRTELTKAETECVKTKNAISSLEGEMKKSADETKRMESAYGKLKDTISNQEDKLRKLKTEYANVVISQGKNSDAAKKLGKEISNLSGELNQNKDKMRDAEKAADKLDKSLDKVGKGAEGAAKGGFTVLKVAMGNLISEGIMRLVDAVKNQMGDALWRVDTVNSFITTMENLGYSSEETAESIEKLKAAAKGMPTTLPALAEMQGQFAALRGDMTEATDLTVALSYATLAGSKSQDEANRALDQWYQIIANGKPNLTSWRIINKAMPAQLNQVAKSILGVDQKSQDLFETWKDDDSGEFTDKVINALISLNKEGGGGLGSFEKQARDATAGINTSMQNIKNAISIGIADVVETIGSENIVAVLNSLRELIGNTFKGIADAIRFVTDHKTEFITALSAMGTAIGAYVGFTTALKVMKDGWMALKTVQELVTIAQTVLNAVMAANPIGLIIAAIAGLVAAFTVLWNNSEDFRNFWINLWDDIEGAVKVVIDAVVEWFNGMWDKIKPVLETAEEIFFAVCDAIGRAAKVVIDFVVGQFIDAWNDIKAAWDFAVRFYKSIWDGIKAIFSVTARWFGDMFRAADSTVKNIVSTWGNFFKGVWDSIKNAFSTVGKWFGDIFRGAFDAIKRAFSGLGNFFGSLWDDIKNRFSSIGTAISNAISSSVKSGINAVIRTIENTINSAINLINGAINLINMIPGVGVNKVPALNLPRMARGGVLDDGARLVVAGEAGAEAIVPLENNTAWIRKVANELRGASDNKSELTQYQKNANFREMVSAFKAALQEVKVELDGEEAGKFVEKTVARAIYT